MIKIGSAKPKDKLRIWLQHLLCQASGLNNPSYLFDDKYVYCLSAVSQAQAQLVLGYILQGYAEALRKPLPGFLISAGLLHKLIKKQEDTEAQQQAIHKQWQPENIYQLAADGDDPYIRRCFDSPLLCWQGFYWFSHQFLLPAFDACEKPQKLADFFAKENK